MPPTSAYFDFMDVGMGDCTFIRGPGDEVVLVDFGSTKNRNVGPPDAVKFMKPYLEARRKIDLLVLTHSDVDHHNQLARLFKEIPALRVKTLIYGGEKHRYTAIDIDGLPVDEIKVLKDAYLNEDPAKADFNFSGLKIWILIANWPSAKAVDPNDASIVLKLEFGGRRVILPGDATSVTEGKIMSEFDPDDLVCNLLKLPHHGSDTSSSDDWINGLKPKSIVISADNNPGYGLPKKEIIMKYVDNGSLVASGEHSFVWFDKTLADPDRFQVVKTKKLILGTLATKEQGAQNQLEVRSDEFLQIQTTYDGVTWGTVGV